MPSLALRQRSVLTPMASLTFVDTNRQWFKSKLGLTGRETSRDISFCAHAINGEKLFVVEDAQKDDRFRSYSNVTGDPGLRFYAGMPLISTGGHALGTLCVLDTVPRKLTEVQSRTLRILAESALRVLDLRRNSGVALFANAVDMTSVAKKVKRQAQQLHAMQTTLATVDHVMRNFMNAAQLYSTHVSSGKSIDGRMQEAFQSALDRTRKDLSSLRQLSMFKDRPTPFGVTLLDTEHGENG